MSTIHIKFDGDRLIGEDLARELYHSQVKMEDVDCVVFPQEVVAISISFADTFNRLLKEKVAEWQTSDIEVFGSIKFLKKYNSINNIPSNIYVADVDYWGDSTRIKRGELVILSHTSRNDAVVILDSGHSRSIPSATFMLAFTKCK